MRQGQAAVSPGFCVSAQASDRATADGTAARRRSGLWASAQAKQGTIGILGRDRDARMASDAAWPVSRIALFDDSPALRRPHCPHTPLSLSLCRGHHGSLVA